MSVTDQSPRCKVTARVKFLDIPIAPLQGAEVGGGIDTIISMLSFAPQRGAKTQQVNKRTFH